MAVRGRAQIGTRSISAVLLALASAGIGFNGPNVYTATLGIFVVCFCMTIYLPLGFNVVQRIINPDTSLKWLLVPWLLTINGIQQFVIYTGIPVIPYEWLVPWYSIYYLIVGGTGILLFRYGFSSTSGTTRQQLTWIFSGAMAANLAVLVLIIIGMLIDDTAIVSSFGSLTQILTASGAAMAVLRPEFGIIDRAASAAATYTVLAIIIALTLELAIEPAAGFMAVQLGLPETTGQSALVVILVLIVPSIKSKVQPIIDRFLNLNTDIQKH